MINPLAVGTTGDWKYNQRNFGAEDMKFAVFEKDGQARLATVVDDSIVDISTVLGTYFPDLGAFLAAGWGDRLNDVARVVETIPLAERLSAEQVFHPPVAKPGKTICIGLNYRDHAEEAGLPIPENLVVFLRVTTSLTGHNQEIRVSPLSTKLDFEGELAIIMGKQARNVSQDEALGCVFGYTAHNDFSYRDYQFRTHQWTVGKNFDATGPLGPVVVTTDELPKGAKGLRIVTRINGVVVQDGNTDNMIFDVAKIISDLSSTMTLEAGDIIATGTPAGIGGTRKPPLWLKAGDICEVFIDGIGALSNPIK